MFDISNTIKNLRMNFNNQNKGYSWKKRSDYMVSIIIFSLFGLVIIAINPLSVFALALIISIGVYVTVFRRSFVRKFFLFLLGGVYAILMFIYSLSPRIQYEEFKIIHPHWKEVEGNISKFDVSWKGGKRRKSVAKIFYQYTINSKRFKAIEDDAIENKSYSVFWVSDEGKKQYNRDLKQSVNEYIRDKNFRILTNVQTNECKIFIPLNFILLSNSSGFNILVTFLKIMLVPLLFVFVLSLITERLKRRQ